MSGRFAFASTRAAAFREYPWAVSFIAVATGVWCFERRAAAAEFRREAKRQGFATVSWEFPA